MVPFVNDWMRCRKFKKFIRIRGKLIVEKFGENEKNSSSADVTNEWRHFSRSFCYLSLRFISFVALVPLESKSHKSFETTH